MEGNNIKVGETATISVSEIDINKDRITEYTWRIFDGTETQDIKTAVDKLDFTPAKPGTYKIGLSQIQIDGRTPLESTNDNSVKITVDVNSNIPETGDKFEMIPWFIVFALASGIIILTVRKRKVH